MLETAERTARPCAVAERYGILIKKFSLGHQLTQVFKCQHTVTGLLLSSPLMFD